MGLSGDLCRFDSCVDLDFGTSPKQKQGDYMSTSYQQSDHMFSERDVTEERNTINLALDAGALFKVHTQPVTVDTDWGQEIERVQEGKYQNKPSHNIYYRTRDDQKRGPLQKILNVAHPSHPSSNYQQFLEMMEAVFPMSCINVDVLDGGARLACRWTLDEPVDLGGGDIVQPHILGLASLNSTWTTSVITFVNRVFCTNQQRLGGKVISVRRSTNHDINLHLRATVLADKADSLVRYMTNASTLKHLQLSDGEFWRMVDIVVPEPEMDDEGKVHGRTQNVYDKKISAISYYWQEEKDGPAGATAWGAWNAIQSMEFHDLANTKAKKVEVVRGKQPYSDTAMAYLQELETV